MQRLLNLLRLTRPLYLLFVALTYVLGTGVARYLGHHLDLTVFWLGLVGVILAQASMSMLAEVFRPFNEPIVAEETVAERRALQSAALYVSIAALAATAFIAVLFYNLGHLESSVILFLGLSLIILIAYSVPPLRLSNMGFGELLLAVHLAYVVPSIGFLLQAGDYHSLLNTVTVPLTFLALAVFLTLDFPAYAQDIKYLRRTLLTRIGWQHAIPLHHGLIFTAYILLAAAPLLGFSLALLWPVFLSLPFALLEAFWLRNIGMGAKPVWPLLTANAVAVFGLSAYFLTLTFWLR